MSLGQRGLSDQLMYVDSVLAVSMSQNEGRPGIIDAICVAIGSTLAVFGARGAVNLRAGHVSVDQYAARMITVIANRGIGLYSGDLSH